MKEYYYFTHTAKNQSNSDMISTSADSDSVSTVNGCA